MGRFLTNEEFILSMQKVHGDRYDYSASVYISGRIKVEILCRIHGSFKQRPKDHKCGKGCPICGGHNLITNSIFIQKSNKIHGNKYDYSKTVFINTAKKVKIICKEHGIFTQTPNGHMDGHGCAKCGVVLASEGRRKFHRARKQNQIYYGPVPYKSRMIPLSRGEFAIVDEDQYESLSKTTWNYNRGYAVNNKIIGAETFMHRVIMNVTDRDVIVDHKNRYPLDNRRQNLRECTFLQNTYNTRPQENSTSKYKGVCWNTRAGKWIVSISPKNRKLHIGFFTSEILAAQAYDLKAKELFGEFAYLNFPDQKTGTDNL